MIYSIDSRVELRISCSLIIIPKAGALVFVDSKGDFRNSRGDNPEIAFSKDHIGLWVVRDDLLSV